jgi:thiamine biosynthesis lipoprotein
VVRVAGVVVAAALVAPAATGKELTILSSEVADNRPPLRRFIQVVPMHTPSRREALQIGAAGVAAAVLNGSPVAASPDTINDCTFHYDHVLGTSLDGRLIATSAAAEHAERVVLDEIERLRTVFSVHDPESELSRLNRANGPVWASADLLAVLREYERWQRQSGGACNGQVGALTRAWDEAAKRSELPDAAGVAAVVRRIASPGWRIDGDAVTRLTDQPLNLNSIAKGYILHRAAEAVKAVPGVSAGLLDLGGDLCAWGDVEWAVGVQDPFTPADNASPHSTLRLRLASVATSGSYQRWYEASGVRRSHILDPRTGYPADAVASATVIAPDSVTANALATVLCVLGAEAGLRLVAEIPGAAALLIDATGREHRSPNFVHFRVPDDKKDDAKKGEAWPADYEVKVKLELPAMGGRYRRPYVAVWVEDADGKPVRTVTVWGSNQRWISTLSGWWKVGKEDKALVKAVTRATRQPGKYEVVWDGKDDAGKALPQGTYTIKVEVHREHGKDVTQTGKLECKAEAVKLTLEKNAETEETTVEYTKKEKKK